MDPSLNENLHGAKPEEHVYWIQNNEVDQLRWHIHVDLQSIGQIPIVYKIKRVVTSSRRTQPYGENETLASNIYDLIIDTISEIRQPIAAIAHSENQEDPKFQNLLDFPKVDSTFYDFPEAEAGGSGPPEPPKT